MKPTYLYVAVDDIKPALAFYRDELGLDEVWREGEGTVAFSLPGSDVQIMLDERIDDAPHWATGPMFYVDDVDAWRAEHPSIPQLGERITAPGGVQIDVLTDPGGNAFHVFDFKGEDTSEAPAGSPRADA